MRVLVVNAGSSSLKLRLLEADDTVTASYDVTARGGAFTADDVVAVVSKLPRPDAVGHRVVHGGAVFTMPVVIDDEVDRVLHSLVDLAPLHQPKSLAGIDAVRAALRDVPEVACFDTAFHATLPRAAATYAVPAEWRERYDARRFGFHGLSHAYASRRAGELTGGRRIVTCHLGAGASLAAVLDGRSVDTTMGFTPLEGLVMATRSGSVDPGLLLWLEEHEGLSSREVAEALEHRSGLLGLAGTTDMREVVTRALASDGDARLALEVYLHRLTASVAAMTASLGGLDTLVFTGGVGENSAPVRGRAAERLAFLGVAVDADRNGAVHGDGEIGADGSAVRTLVLTAREDVEIARQTRAAVTARA
jgi:acetate kinase